MRDRFYFPATWLLASMTLIGCGTQATPTSVPTVAPATPAIAQLKSVHVQINGFMKSKSGAT